MLTGRTQLSHEPPTFRPWASLAHLQRGSRRQAGVVLQPSKGKAVLLGVLGELVTSEELCSSLMEGQSTGGQTQPSSTQSNPVQPNPVQPNPTLCREGLHACSMQGLLLALGSWCIRRHWGEWMQMRRAGVPSCPFSARLNTPCFAHVFAQGPQGLICTLCFEIGGLRTGRGVRGWRHQVWVSNPNFEALLLQALLFPQKYQFKAFTSHCREIKSARNLQIACLISLKALTPPSSIPLPVSSVLVTIFRFARKQTKE